METTVDNRYNCWKSIEGCFDWSMKEEKVQMGKVAKVQKKQNDEGLCQCSIIDCSTLVLTRVMCCGLEKRESLLVI